MIVTMKRDTMATAAAAGAGMATARMIVSSPSRAPRPAGSTMVSMPSETESA